MISTRSVGLLIDTVVCLTLAKWETVSGRFGGYINWYQGHRSQEGIHGTETKTKTSSVRIYRRDGSCNGVDHDVGRCAELVIPGLPASIFACVLIPGPQIHDSWALPQWGRVRFNTANRGGSSCRLRYHYARILMRRSCGVWPGEAKMALKPDGFWRLRRSMTVRRAPRRPRSAVSDFRSSGTGCCASTPAVLTVS